MEVAEGVVRLDSIQHFIVRWVLIAVVAIRHYIEYPFVSTIYSAGAGSFNDCDCLKGGNLISKLGLLKCACTENVNMFDGSRISKRAKLFIEPQLPALNVCLICH